DVAMECRAGTSARYFRFNISDAGRRAFQGLRLFVHGVRTDTSVGGFNAELSVAAGQDNTMPLDTNLRTRLMPGVPAVYMTPQMLQTLLADRANVSAKVRSYFPRTPEAMAAVQPDFGTGYKAFSDAADVSLSQLPLLALACQMASSS